MPLVPRQFKEKEEKEETQQKDAKLQLRRSARIGRSLEHKRAKLESRQEVNCTLIGAQNKEDRKELKRKLWTDPRELVATRNGQGTTPSEEDTPGLRPKLVPGDREKPELRGKRWISPIQNPELAGKDAVAGHDPL